MSSIPYYGRGPQREQAQKWAYYTAIGKRLGLTDIDPKHCAFIVIDIQEGCVEPNGFMGSVGAYNRELLEVHKKRLKEIVWPNLEKLIEFFRSKNIMIIYTVLGRGNVHPRLSPRKDEWVINKYVAGAFGNTILDKILRDNEIDTIFFTGTDTAGCVSLTAYGALDHGYRVVLVEDACLSNRPDTHEAAVKLLSLFAYVQKTESVINDYPWQSWIDTNPNPKPTPLNG